MNAVTRNRIFTRITSHERILSCLQGAPYNQSDYPFATMGYLQPRQ